MESHHGNYENNENVVFNNDDETHLYAIRELDNNRMLCLQSGFG